MDIWFFSILNNASVNIHVQVFVWTPGYIRETCWLYGLPSEELPDLFSKVVAPFSIPNSSIWGFQFIYTVANTFLFYFSLFLLAVPQGMQDLRSPNRYETPALSSESMES